MAGGQSRVGQRVLGWAGWAVLLRAVMAIPWAPLRLAGIVTVVVGPVVVGHARRAWRQRSLWHGSFALLTVVLVGLAFLGAQGSREQGDVEFEPGAVATTPGGQWLVDLNRASRAELEALPGVGPDRAAAIIVGRAERPFASLADAVERGVLPAAVAEELEGWVGVFEVEPAP